MITPILNLVTQDPQVAQNPEAWQHWQLPEQASTFSADHDNLYVFVEWINYIFFFGIMAVLFYAVVKYRRKTPDQPPASTVTHHTAIEVTWTVVPLIVVMVIFAWGWKGYADMTLAPADALQYEVKAKRWSWSFKHPTATDFCDKEIWVPVDTPVQLTMSSVDVLHSFFIPAFRVKRDVLPGRFQTVWFNATKTGDFHIFCTEFCGEGHAQMLGTIHVVSAEEWKEALVLPPWDDWSGTPVENGAKVHSGKCIQCHTLDGRVTTGPSFKGLYTRNAKRLGIDTSDPNNLDPDGKFAEYVKESIRNPNAHIADGFKPPSAMTPFSEADVNEERLADIIAFLLSEKLK